MNFIKTISIVSFGLFAGCTSMEVMRPALTSLEGKPVQVAFDVLGFPDQEQAIAGKKVYVWATSHEGSYTVPNNTTATTYVQGQAITTTIYGTSTETYNANCKIRVIASASGMIEDWDAEGNEFGCGPYAEKLRPLVPKKKA